MNPLIFRTLLALLVSISVFHPSYSTPVDSAAPFIPTLSPETFITPTHTSDITRPPRPTIPPPRTIPPATEDCKVNDKIKSSEDGIETDVTSFALRLFRKVALTATLGAKQGRGQGRAGGTMKNVVIAPFSVWGTMSLALLGAKGRTSTELARALGHKSKGAAWPNWRDVENRLKGNSIFTSFRSITKAYFPDTLPLSHCITTSFPHLIQSVNFSNPVLAASQINAEVEETTEGRIKDFLDSSVLAEAQFVLLNAMFFKGKWEEVFDGVGERGFKAEGEVVPVEMMSRVGTYKIAFTSPLNAQVLELPYANSTFAMYILLPSDPEGGTGEVLKGLTRGKLEGVLADMAEVPLNVTLPKFSVETKITEELKEALQEIGIQELFSSRANLSGFSETIGVQDTTAVHEARLEVSEEGTVAAAATAILGTRITARPLVVDRPFVFLVLERASGVPVITGVYNHPGNA